MALTFELLQNSVQNSTINVDYYVTVSTGSITYVCIIDSLIGFSLDPSTNTGDIILNEYETKFTLFPYYSENYQEASNIHDITLSISTGSIEIIGVFD